MNTYDFGDVLSYHLDKNVTRNNILIGDQKIFDKINECEDVKTLEETANMYLDKLYEYLPKDGSSVDFIIEDEIDEAIKEFIESIQNDFVKKELLCLSNGPKKKIRSRLALNLMNENNYHLCALIEMFHLATLIQDDIIDHAKYRRFNETINYKHNDFIALLVSDVLLCHVLFEIKKLVIEFEEYGTKEDQEIIQNHTNEMISNLIDSEILENQITKIEEYNSYASKKTGGLFGYSLLLGYLSNKKVDKEVDKEEIETIYEFGNEFGIIFQKIDDYEDVFANFEELGKDGNDEKNKVANYVLFLQKELSLEEIQQQLAGELNNLYENNTSDYFKREIEILKRRIK